MLAKKEPQKSGATVPVMNSNGKICQIHTFKYYNKIERKYLKN